MRLSIDEVEHIAELARLELSDSEKQRYAEQLSDILDYFRHLEELDTDQISPTASVLDMNLRLREDAPLPGLPSKDVLRNSADTQDEQFKVPPVFGG
jgi:aspartyl-tRNA(Asn)/glutamyl-tRNA(Gln) amidotransferase subunit C